MSVKKGDHVVIVGSAEESLYKDCVFEVLSDPYPVCGKELVKMKCHETGKYFAGGYSTEFLRPACDEKDGEPRVSRWIDATSYSQREKERIPRTWELEGAPHRIAVHRHTAEPDAWFVSCYPLDIDTRRLGTMDAEAAQEKALELVMSVINERITELQGMYMFVRGARDNP